jgi:hypothetical protein
VSDDPGVMGNLPHSRPGRRSDKRTSKSSPKTGGSRKKSSGTSGKARPRAASAKSAGAAAKSGTRTAPARASGAGSRSTGAGTSRAPSPSAARGPDPIGEAVRIATKLAGAGLGMAAGVLRRLPKP